MFIVVPMSRLQGAADVCKSLMFNTLMSLLLFFFYFCSRRNLKSNTSNDNYSISYDLFGAEGHFIHREKSCEPLQPPQSVSEVWCVEAGPGPAGPAVKRTRTHKTQTQI